MEKKYNRIGIVGAGVIGSSVAQLFLRSGVEVILLDNNPEKLVQARRDIARYSKLVRMLGDGKSAGATDASLERQLQTTGDLARLAEAEFVIENVTENWAIKSKLHAEIDRVLDPAVPVAANTSAILITRISSLHRRPERVLGMHFMNPAPLMPVVEVIRGMRTSPDILAAGTALVAQAGKQSITVNDSPGFVTNRVMMQMVNEAMFLVYEGVSSVQDVDRLFKTCFGHKMGPLETADLIGLDTVLLSIEVIQEEFNDSKYRPCPLLKNMVYAGRLGRKTGKGFYDY